MKESKAHKFSLTLPLVIPALLAILVYLDFPFPKWLAQVAVLTVYSGLVGGIPYVMLVALLFWWGRGKSDTQFKRALILSPILMLPLFFVFLVLLQLITGFPDGVPGVSDVMEALLIYVPFILGFGYAYVLLVLGAVFVLKRLGMVAPSPAMNKALQLTAR